MDKKPVIKIKASKEGSFVKWAISKGLMKAGEELTDAVIKAGMKSGDPAIRKKAVFAMNARKWSKDSKGEEKPMAKAATKPEDKKKLKPGEKMVFGKIVKKGAKKKPK